MTFWHHIRSLRADRTAGIGMVVAASLPVFLGGVALAVDTVQWSLAKRQMQRQADSGALAGAFGLAQSRSVATSVNRDLAKNNFVPLTINPVIENAPTAGAYAGNARAVRVVLETDMRLPFSGLFISGVRIGSEATAAVLGLGEYCVVALDTSDETGIDMTGNTTVKLGCGMISNTVGNESVDAGGSSTIEASPIAGVGYVPPAPSNYATGTTLISYAIPQQDPFADLADPVMTGTNYNRNAATIGPNKPKVTLNPGVYQSMSLNGNVKLNPGTYYIKGDLGFGAQAAVEAIGVTFVLTNNNPASGVGNIDMNGNSKMTLSAPTTGTYAGVLFYQDRRAPTSGGSKFNGTSSSMMQGAIYMPREDITFNGTTGMNVKCLQMVTWRMTFTGTSEITNVCPANSGAGSFPGTVIRLVG
jgi:hypothetical protein